MYAIRSYYASGQLEPSALTGCEFAGELSLSGELRPMRGAFAMALHAKRAGRAFVLPASNADEAARAGHDDVLAATTLLEVCRITSYNVCYTKLLR